MSIDTAVETGRYIYAFIDANSERVVRDQGLCGLNDSSVEVIRKGELAAVVSPIANAKIRPQRKVLAAHQHVVTQVSQLCDTLPVAFGLVAADEASISDILERHADVLNEQLHRVSSHVEMFVSATWTAENVFQYFVERYPLLSDFRQRIASGTATRDEQIELGRTFESILQQERETHTQKVLDVISSLCKEYDVQAVRNEKEIFRIACLVRRDQEQQFNEAIYKAASLFDDGFAFSFNGPWPAYSFVKLALTLES